MIMILVALAAAIAAPPSGTAHRPTSAVRQATASVRILCGARVGFGKPTGGSTCSGHRPTRYDRQVHERDGTVTAATLVEFP